MTFLPAISGLTPQPSDASQEKLLRKPMHQSQQLKVLFLQLDQPLFIINKTHYKTNTLQNKHITKQTHYKTNTWYKTNTLQNKHINKTHYKTNTTTNTLTKHITKQNKHINKTHYKTNTLTKHITKH